MEFFGAIVNFFHFLPIAKKISMLDPAKFSLKNIFCYKTKFKEDFNPIQDWPFCDCSRMGKARSQNFFWVLKGCLSKHGPSLDDVSKISTSGLLKIKVFWNKGYVVIIHVLDLTCKVIFCYSNNAVDVVMWAKFGHSSNSMREVTTTSIL